MINDQNKKVISIKKLVQMMYMKITEEDSLK